MSADNRPIHRHVNQVRLNAIGVAPANPFDLTSSGETPDMRTWHAIDGPKDEGGLPIPGNWDGVIVQTMRVSPGSKIFVRSITFDGGGAIFYVGVEVAMGGISGSMFEMSGTGIQPKASTVVGDSDHFYLRQADGMVARDDFEVGDETTFMRETNLGESVELKDLE